MTLHTALVLLAIYVCSRKSYTIYQPDGSRYLTRYYLVGRWFRNIFNRNLFLHHFWASDSRELHSHRWKSGWSLILWGGYTEFRQNVLGIVDGKKIRGHTEVKVFRPGSINKLDSKMFHRTELLNERRGVWTLFWAGPFATEEWGFIKEDNTYESAVSRFAGNRDALNDD